MFDKFEKLSLGFNELVRYLLTGVVTSIALFVVTNPKIYKVDAWLSKFPGIWKNVSVPIILVFLGYLVYHFYRGFIYQLGLLPLRGWIGKLSGIYIHRDFIRDTVQGQTGRKIPYLETESLYALWKATKFAKFYQEFGTSLTTSIHVLYCCNLVLLGATLFRLKQLWVPFLVLLVSFIAINFMDWHFEKLELLFFAQHKAKLEKEICALDKAGIWDHFPTSS